MFTKEQRIFLGLTEKEFKICRSIAEEPKSIFVVSKDTNIPRGTLYPIIQKLYARGFIKVKRQGERFVYKMMDKEKMKEKLEEIVTYLRS